LSALSVEEREGAWRKALEGRTSDTFTWVADESGEVLGWISAARSRDEDAHSSTGEVWGIYVDPRHWRRGAGELLLQEAEGHLRDSGFTEVTLWVFRENARAIAFYESKGFSVEPGREKRLERGGAEIPGIRLRKSLGG
jgi:ribosomal protein S18 acetylase RimI-like enzyme